MPAKSLMNNPQSDYILKCNNLKLTKFELPIDVIVIRFAPINIIYIEKRLNLVIFLVHKKSTQLNKMKIRLFVNLLTNDKGYN